MEQQDKMLPSHPDGDEVEEADAADSRFSPARLLTVQHNDEDEMPAQRHPGRKLSAAMLIGMTLLGALYAGSHFIRGGPVSSVQQTSDAQRKPLPSDVNYANAKLPTSKEWASLLASVPRPTQRPRWLEDDISRMQAAPPRRDVLMSGQGADADASSSGEYEEPKPWTDIGFSAGSHDEGGNEYMEDTDWIWITVGGGISKKCSHSEGGRRLADSWEGAAYRSHEEAGLDLFSVDDSAAAAEARAALSPALQDAVKVGRRLRDNMSTNVLASPLRKLDEEVHDADEEGIYFHVVEGLHDVAECQKKCGRMPVCYGISFATPMAAVPGRCELWLVPIHGAKVQFGYICLRAYLKTTRFHPINGGMNKLCTESSSAGDASILFGERMTLPECKRVCANYVRCHGISWREEVQTPGPTWPHMPAGPCRAYPFEPTETEDLSKSICLRYERIKGGEFLDWDATR